MGHLGVSLSLIGSASSNGVIVVLDELLDSGEGLRGLLSNRNLLLDVHTVRELDPGESSLLLVGELSCLDDLVEFHSVGDGGEGGDGEEKGESHCVRLILFV